jgi:hypothetical protein
LALLSIPDEVFDEIHVASYDGTVDTHMLEAIEQGKPRGVDIRGREALFGVVAHVRNVLVRAGNGT